MSIKSQLEQVKSSIPEDVCLVAVSKTKPDEDLIEAYEAGQRILGENKVQELVGKYERLPKDIEWHMIGHLQSNKVKYIAPFVRLIHAVDSQKLLKEINKEAKKNDRVIDCLVQLHIAEEEHKFGFSPKNIEEQIAEIRTKGWENIRIVGLMGMATFTDDMDQVRMEFRTLKQSFDRLKETAFATDDAFKTVSMGMSGDYQIAIEEGSTMVRVGSTIFGARNYAK
jgi:pyridoxal phosphate enzyme (YggS family)